MGCTVEEQCAEGGQGWKAAWDQIGRLASKVQA